MTPDRPPPRILSFGGGVQSSALVALLLQDRYPCAPPQEVWFCDPRSEQPQTYTWIADVIRPALASATIPFLLLERHTSPSRGPDLMQSFQRNAAYPLRSNRVCTIEWKVRVMAAEARRRGWHAKDHPPVEKHLGISLDELHRARTTGGREATHETLRYPLIEARLFRDDCIDICHAFFGKAPVKSGCWWCKYQSEADWRRVWEERADGRWDKAVAWEERVIARRGPTCTFIRGARSLQDHARAWEQGTQLALPTTEQHAACDGGYCLI